jgi:hypothetical protein
MASMTHQRLLPASLTHQRHLWWRQWSIDAIGTGVKRDMATRMLVQQLIMRPEFLPSHPGKLSMIDRSKRSQNGLAAQPRST